LDRGDADAGIQDLVAFLKRSPNNIEARAALVAAYTQNGDPASAGRESARLVSAYVVARDLDGGMASLAEHRRSHPEVPVALRSLLALAAHREKEERHREAADLYREAVKAWPDDPLLPKARIAYGRLMLEVFQQPDDTLAILEGAVASPQTTPEFRRAAEELIAAARRARRAGGEHQEAAPATAGFEPTSLTARAPEASRQESTPSAMWEAPSVAMEPSASAPDAEATPAATPGLSSQEPAVSAMGAMASVDMETPAPTSQMETVPEAPTPAATEPAAATIAAAVSVLELTGASQAY
jgi:tetratricopeptide (TPR) repeat protein